MKLAPLWLAVALAFAPVAPRAQTGQDDIVTLLLRADFDSLEQSLGATQQRFESGALTEYELQKAFEPFATPRDAQALEKLIAWVRAAVSRAGHDLTGADALFRQAL